MSAIDVSVRVPTNWAWGTSFGSVIACGELIHLARLGGAASLFGIELSHGALIAGAVLSGLFAAACLAWLVSLYLRPGRLLVDLEQGIIQRELRPLFARQVVRAPLQDWLIRLVFYSRHTHSLGSFKRLELNGPEQHEEVLVFTDVRRGEELAAALVQLEQTACDFEVVIQQEQAPDADHASQT